MDWRQPLPRRRSYRRRAPIRKHLPCGSGPIIGTLLFFALRETLADYGTIYLIALGVVAILVMLKAPKGVWGLIRDRYDLELFPLSYRVRVSNNGKEA